MRFNKLRLKKGQNIEVFGQSGARGQMFVAV